MQYVRNLSDSVSTAWNSINPATLSGAIDVIVVEQEDGTLLCSPFHVRFGKFSLLRPSEKKVEFRVNGAKQDYGMKLGEGGEAFFVFETSDTIPQAMQTSPPMSPASSPPLGPSQSTPTLLPEPDPLSLDSSSKPARRNRSSSRPRRPGPTVIHSTTLPPGDNLFLDPGPLRGRAATAEFGDSAARPYSDNEIRKSSRPGARGGGAGGAAADPSEGSPSMSDRSHSPPAPLSAKAALERAVALSRDLSAANIPTHVTSDGDLMLDMTAFKSNEEDALRAEVFARKLLTDELDGNYDVGSLFGLDEHGNLWIYSSQDAKEAATRRAMAGPPIHSSVPIAVDAASDPGYQSDGSDLTALRPAHEHRRADSDLAGIAARPAASAGRTAGDPNRNYAKTLRLTSDQIRALDLRPGENAMSFTVNRATCHAFMYLWRHDTPVVISDIDGTITKSDALGHVLNMIGRDWTHSGIAKLYSDIAANGYNIMYLTSRSVGQADTTRAYLSGIVQDGGFRLPRGPTILSPDRTMAALRREIYLRKPHVFKMATLRDIRSLYPGGATSPFHAGFGNRFTDQISYRTVDVPRTRIFTINSNAEVSLDLLSLNRLKLSYVNINEVVDHYFPPVSTLVKGACEDYTDFKYWRDTLLDVDQFSASESEAGADDADDDEEDDEVGDTHEVEAEEEEAEEGDEEEDEDEEDEEGDGEYEEEDAEGSAYADDEDEEELVVLDQGTDEAMGDSYFPQRAVEAEDGADNEGRGGLIEEEQAEEALPREEGRGDGEKVAEPTPAAERAASPSPPRPISSPRLPPTQVVEDIGAEAMTGLENLSLERRVGEADRAPEGE